MAKRAVPSNNSYFNIVVDQNKKPFFGIYHANEAEGLTQIETFDNEGKSKGVKLYDLYEELEGKIISVGVYDKELDNNKKYEVLTIKVKTSEGKNEILNVPFQSQWAQSFIKCIESVVVEENVKLRVFKVLDKEKSEAKGKKIYKDYLCIYQFDEQEQKDVTVKSKYKFMPLASDPKVNANPDKLPEFEKKEIKKSGKKVIEYDTAEFDEALRDIIKNINPAFKAASEMAAPTTKENTPGEKDTQSEDNNDLPL